jgi:hypothetical protein
VADLDPIFERLSRDPFRRKFRLFDRERAFVERWGIEKVLKDARQIIRDRIAPAQPKNDGKQTPWRNHPVFIAQHATATCCRGCIAKFHDISKGEALTTAQIDYLVEVIGEWIARQSR